MNSLEFHYSICLYLLVSVHTPVLYPNYLTRCKFVLSILYIYCRCRNPFPCLLCLAPFFCVAALPVSPFLPICFALPLPRPGNEDQVFSGHPLGRLTRTVLICGQQVSAYMFPASPGFLPSFLRLSLPSCPLLISLISSFAPVSPFPSYSFFPGFSYSVKI